MSPLFPIYSFLRVLKPRFHVNAVAQDTAGELTPVSFDVIVFTKSGGINSTPAATMTVII
jgi:hypothetical protein